MKVLTAKTKSYPRTVATKYGEKSVIDIWVEGETQSIWRPANDPAIMGLRSNQDIQVTKDSKGKISLVDNAPTIDQGTKLAGDHGLTTEQKREIAQYITQQRDLLAFCLDQAATIPQAQTDDSVQKLGVTLYLATQKRFNLA